MKKPAPKHYPFTNSFSGGDLLQIRGVTEHYFPSLYNNFICTVNSFDVEIKNFRQMEIRVRFKIQGENNDIKNLYKDEGWKFMRTEDLLKRFPEQNKKLKTPAPLFCLMLNKYLQVIEASIKTSGPKETGLVYDLDADMLVMPTSYPPLVGENPENIDYIYYDKKAAVFYSDIEFNTEYEINILLDANAATFEFAPLFPYGKVIFNKINNINSSEYEITPSISKVKPEIKKEFPKWFQYQLDKISSIDMVMPHFRPALPYRGTFPLFNLAPGSNEKIRSLSKKELLKLISKIEVNITKSVLLENYETIRFAFAIIIPPDKDTDVIVRTIKRPLPPRIYEQMQKLPNYRDVLVEYDIINLSHKKFRLRVETEILGYSEKETKVIFVHAINNKNNQKARTIVAQCPRLKKDILEQLTDVTKTTMSCKVKDEDTKEIIFEETFPIDILPNDEMVWEIEDLRSNNKYNLRDFICAWITPTDKLGLLDKVRSEARSFHPDNTLGHKLETLGDYMEHVKALYDYLAKEGMNYLSQPFSSYTSGQNQRVILPEKVLINKAGNCIDLTVLFASLLEGFGIYSILFLTPTHAFIGWGNKNNDKEMFFLETTLIGRNDFDTAMKKGREVFEDSFMMNKMSKPIYMPDLRRIDGNFIVDMQKARHSGQVSARKG